MIYSVIVSGEGFTIIEDHDSLYRSMRHCDRLLLSGFNVIVKCYEVREKRRLPVFSLVYNSI